MQRDGSQICTATCVPCAPPHLSSANVFADVRLPAMHSLPVLTIKYALLLDDEGVNVNCTVVQQRVVETCVKWNLFDILASLVLLPHSVWRYYPPEQRWYLDPDLRGPPRWWQWCPTLLRSPRISHSPLQILNQFHPRGSNLIHRDTIWSPELFWPGRPWNWSVWLISEFSAFTIFNICLVLLKVLIFWGVCQSVHGDYYGDY